MAGVQQSKFELWWLALCLRADHGDVRGKLLQLLRRDGGWLRAIHVSALFASRAWMLTPFLKLVSPDYFMADYDLICDVGRLTRATGLAEDLADYHSHPYNRSFARRRLRLRVSVRRVTKEVHRLLPGPAAANFYDSAQPFRDGVAEDAPASKAPPHSARS